MHLGYSGPPSGPHQAQSPNLSRPGPLPTTQALVLSLQQLVGGEGAAPGGVYSVSGIASTAAPLGSLGMALPLSAGPSVSGLEGLLGVSLGLCAMLVASVPRSDGGSMGAEAVGEEAVPLAYSPEELSRCVCERKRVHGWDPFRPSCSASMIQFVGTLWCSSSSS